MKKECVYKRLLDVKMFYFFFNFNSENINYQICVLEISCRKHSEGDMVLTRFPALGTCCTAAFVVIGLR